MITYRLNKDTDLLDLTENGRVIASFWLRAEMVKARDALRESGRRPLQDFIDTRYDVTYESFKDWCRYMHIHGFAQYKRKRFYAERRRCHGVRPLIVRNDLVKQAEIRNEARQVGYQHWCNDPMKQAEYRAKMCNPEWRKDPVRVAAAAEATRRGVIIREFRKLVKTL